MSAAQTKCLLAALRTIRTDSELDPDMANKIAEGLEYTIAKYNTQSELQLRKMILKEESLRRDLYVARVSKAAAELKESEIRTALAAKPAEERATWLRNLMEYDRKYGSQENVGVANQVRAEQRTTHGRLNALYEHLTTTRWFVLQDSEFVRNFHMQARGVDTGDPLAQQMVKLYRDVTTPFLTRLRKAGVWVEEMADYFPQTHNIARITAAGNEWRQFLRDNLDRRNHPDPDSTVEHLEAVLHTRDLPSENARTAISTSRKIKFQTPEAEFEYNARFGEQNFSELLFGTVDSLVRKTVLAERLGPNPSRMLDDVIKDLSRDLRAARAKAAERGDKAAESRLADAETRSFVGVPIIQGELNAAQAIARGLTGDLLTPENQTLANWFAAGRNMMTFSMLGQVAWAAVIQDSWNAMFGARFHTGGFGRGISQMIGTTREMMTDTDARRYAEDMGWYYNALASSNTERLSTPTEGFEQQLGERAGTSMLASAARKGTAKAAVATQRLSLANLVDRSLRAGFGVVASRNLMHQLQTRNWADLPARYQTMLRANAIDERMWRSLQRDARAVPNVRAVDMQSLNVEQFAAVNTMLNREVELGVVYPNMYDRLMLSLYTKPGTLTGEFVASSTQFLSWPTAMFRGAMSREMNHGGVGQVGYYGAMVATGTLTVQAYAMLTNQPTFEWDSPTLWARGIVRSGLLTPLGEAIMQAASPQGGTLVEGPLPSTVQRVLGSGFGAAMDLVDGESGKAARKALQSVNTAVIPNVWWVNAPLTTRVLDSAMESLDPDYIANRERRFEREGRRVD